MKKTIRSFNIDTVDSSRSIELTHDNKYMSNITRPFILYKKTDGISNGINAPIKSNWKFEEDSLD